MEKRSVSVVGFPATYNELKLKLFVEKHVGKTDILETVERVEGTVVFKFKRSEELQKFLEEELKDITFGNKTYKLTVKMENEFISDARVPDPESRRLRFDVGDRDLWRKKLYVTNIPQHLYSYDMFKYHFERFGKVRKCFMTPDKSFAFVMFWNHYDACQAKVNCVQAGPTGRLDIQWAKEERNQRPASCHQQFEQRANYQSNPNAWQRKSSAGPSSRRYSGDSTLEFAANDNPENKRTKPQPEPRRRSREPEVRQQRVFDGSLFKNTHYWSNLSKLPAPSGSTCVLVQNINPDVHIQKVKMHFESKKRSSGGPLASIVRMIDGFLVVFEKMQDCESCLKHENQLFDEKEIKIFSKKIPDYYKKRFILEGVGDKTTIDTLVMFLEHCSDTETAPSSCLKQSLQGVYLVEYGDEFDVNEMDSILQKTKKEPLEGKSLKASRLLETDCLKVSDVPEKVTADAIRYMFQSEKRTSGGPVTRVEQCGNETALVYFSSFEVARRVYERFKKPCAESVILGQHPVEVDLYFHSLSNTHKSARNDNSKQRKTEGEDAATDSSTPKRPLQSFMLKPEFHENIFFFIRDNKKLMQNLKSVFEELATLDMKHSKKGMSVSFTPQKNHGLETQNGFNMECKKRFEDFSSAYSTITRMFDETRLKNARSLKNYPELERRKKNTTGGKDLYIRWQADKPIVDVTGLKDKVEEMVKNIEMKINIAIVDMEISEKQYRILLHCGILEKLQKTYQKVEVIHDDEKQSIALSGPDSDVAQFHIAALQQIMDGIEKRKLTGIDANVTRFLLESMNLSSAIKTTIQAELTNNSIKATFELDDEEAFIVAPSVDHFNKALEIIKALITVHSFTTDGSFSDVLSSPSWKSFQQKLKKDGQCGLYIKPNQCIFLVAFAVDILLLVKKVSDFLDENAGRKIIFPASYGVAKYIVEKSKEFSTDSCEKRKIKCGLTSIRGGGILLEGKKSDCDKARAGMDHLIKNVKERKHTLHDPGIKDYYESSDGIDCLKSIEHINNCVILTSTPTCKEWEIQNSQSRSQVQPPLQQRFIQAPREQLYHSINLSKTGVSLQVWKTNIIDHDCDVIVNASNPELKLLNGGVSGQIKKFDQNGNAIQNEMNRLVRENHGDFLAGDAGITTSGNLPSCKRIVHAIGPKWNSTAGRIDPKLVLKACISKSLKETEKAGLTSISIPAVSCGIFGGEVKVCIPLIVEAVVEYFEEENKSSQITRVDFVEISNKDILDEFKKSIAKYSTSLQTQNSSAPPPIPQPRFSQNTSSLSVSLIKADITSQNTDVIVNVTSRKGLQGSAISQALLQKGGASIQQSFSQISTPLTPGNVFETQGGNLLCSKLYHSIVSNYSQNSESVIRSIVKQCLNMADQTGYRSIAFPALATGGFGHPAPSVALWMKKEISRFSSTNLRNVYIVLYPHPRNQATISAFEAEFSQSSGGAQTMSSSSSSSVKHGALNISVYQGDITQEKSDAIINSTSSNFDLSNAGVMSQAILSKAGNTIQAEASNATGTDFRVTSGGNLSCNRIFHIATPSNDKNLTKRISLVLENADAMGITSISIPALATGGLGVDSLSVATAMKRAFDDFAKTKIVNLNTINVVIFDPSMLNDFKDVILGQNHSVFSRIKGALSGIFQKFTTGSENVTFDLYIYSTNTSDIDEAIQRITNETNKTFLSQPIQDDVLERLTDLEQWDIMQICKRNRVGITDKSTKYYKQYVLHGLIRDVLKADEAVKDVLKKFAAAETSTMYVLWQKLCGGNWEDYPPQATHILEKAFKARNGDNTDPRLNRIEVPEYDDRRQAKVKKIVDLSNLEGDQSGVNPPKVRRKVKEKGADDAIPSTWEDMRGQRFIKVKLKPHSQEFQNVQKIFLNTGGPRNIIKIQRIQNPTIYKQYMAKKAEVASKQISQNPVERELFHGTADAAKILLHGFDRSYAGKNATAFGKGVYFATAASYSNGYATPNQKGKRKMFLANVVTGDYCLGNSGYVAPPQRPGTVKNDLYDSVVNSMGSPTIFVIFKDASAYPSYLITYA